MVCDTLPVCFSRGLRAALLRAVALRAELFLAGEAALDFAVEDLPFAPGADFDFVCLVCLAIFKLHAAASLQENS
jgi:hypothetical protein